MGLLYHLLIGQIMSTFLSDVHANSTETPRLSLFNMDSQDSGLILPNFRRATSFSDLDQNYDDQPILGLSLSDSDFPTPQPQPAPPISPPPTVRSPSPLQITAGSPTPVREQVPITSELNLTTEATTEFPSVHEPDTATSIDNVAHRLWMITLFPSDLQSNNMLLHLIGEFLLQHKSQLRSMVACRDVAPETGREHFLVPVTTMRLRRRIGVPSTNMLLMYQLVKLWF